MPRDASFAVAVIGQPRPKCLIGAKTLTPCVVQDVDEFERALGPELVAFSLLLKRVLDLHPQARSRLLLMLVSVLVSVAGANPFVLFDLTWLITSSPFAHLICAGSFA